MFCRRMFDIHVMRQFTVCVMVIKLCYNLCMTAKFDNFSQICNIVIYCQFSLLHWSEPVSRVYNVTVNTGYVEDERELFQSRSRTKH